MFQTISPRDWGLDRPSAQARDEVQRLLGVSYEDLEHRCSQAVYSFLERLFNAEEGALHHYYRADTQYLSELDSGNFLMALNYLCLYDRTDDALLLERAASCFRWAYEHWTETHPMFTWQGGCSGRVQAS